MRMRASAQRATILELQARTGYEIDDRARHAHIAGACGFGDARADLDDWSGVAGEIALADVHAGARRHAGLQRQSDERGPALHRASGTIERGNHTVRVLGEGMRTRPTHLTLERSPQLALEVPRLAAPIVR